jgi:hypothetical protein
MASVVLSNTFLKVGMIVAAYTAIIRPRPRPGRKKQAHNDSDVGTVKLPAYRESFKGRKVTESQGR